MLAVGPIVASQAEPTKIRGQTLHVTVSSPAWSQEIQMQQRLILERLKSKLHKAPTRIACWVGKPYALPPGQKAQDKTESPDPAPWATTAIPDHRQARIEATLATLEDPGLQARLRPLIELAVRRELYFLERGQLPCPVCGALRPAREESCEDCRREKLEQAERKLTRLMARKPWLKIRDLQERAPWAGRAHVMRLRKALHANLLMQAWQLSEGLEGPQLEARMNRAFHKLLVDITMLRCFLPKDSLRPFHFRYALGKRLGDAYLSSIANETSNPPDPGP